MSGSFLSSLSPNDLSRLRQVVRKVHMRHWPQRHQTDAQCDMLIEALGEKVVYQQLRQMVDAGQVEKKIFVGSTVNPVSKGKNAS